MRTSEQVALRWGDVDFKSNVVQVQRARVRHEEKETKAATARHHELSARARLFLESHRAFTRLKGEPIFLDPVTGNPYNAWTAISRAVPDETHVRHDGDHGRRRPDLRCAPNAQ